MYTSICACVPAKSLQSCSPPGNLHNPGTEPISHMSPALAGGFFTPEPPEKPVNIYKRLMKMSPG